MRKIHVKSPTRIDLAGGTVDLWPVYSILGGATTINFAIDIYTEAEMTERADAKVIVEMQDVGFKREYGSLVELLNDPDPAVALVRVHAEYFKPAKGFELKTKSESPVGGGLGGSSSLCISLIHAFIKFLDVALSPQQMVTLAHNLEAQVLHVPTGTQDYYPAVLGGLNIIDYTPLGPQAQKLPVKLDFFSSRGFLVYTGKPHQSGLNNWEVLKDFISKNPNTVSCLKAIRRKAQKTREMALNGNWEQLGEIFQESYKLRTSLSPRFTSPEIEKLAELTKKAGGLGVKICGAGGGGCVFVWSSPENKGKVLAECQNAGFKVLNAVPVEQGSRLL